jgi:intracellular septation protein A
MQWLTLGLVAVFGGAALATHNPVFVMVKPTLIYVAVGCVMLRRGWMTRYMTDPRAISHAADVTTRFGYAWAGLMFATGAANLALAVWASPAAWAWFVGVFPLASKIGLVGIQYAMTKSIVRRRVGAG